ncbi:MAG TPA: hypothetical protein VHY79_12050 [Rhizomicrobium sp.]|jgi:hypothetical protein|nr:hypothetical protein [Rhizomicrobium sp.]
MKRYTVTFEVIGQESRAAALDVPDREFTLEAALAHACRLMAEGKNNVTIGDADGHSISGGDLAACCKGDKRLTAKLRAEPLPQ